MASETYTTELAVLKFGHAVWDPNPNGLYKRVRVGDVGHFQDGFFIPLFNILLPADDPSHAQWGVPDDHELLVLPAHSIGIRKKSPLMPGAYHSESVQELSVSGSIGSHQVNAELSFSCTKEKGAVLVLPSLAHREEALFRKKFKDYMLAHYRSWFSFAVDRCGCELEISDLILVTGCDIAKNWAMAAFSNSSSRASGSIGAQAPGFEAKFSLNAGWTTSKFVHHHWGPIRGKDVGTEQEDDAEPDQCVFVRGYRVKERKFLGPKVLEAGAGPHSLGKRRDSHDDDDLMAASSDEDIKSLSESSQRVNLLLPLLDYMLEKSEASVVIAHDEDIWPYIEHDADPVNVRAKLKQGAPSVKLEGEVGILGKDQLVYPAKVEMPSDVAFSFIVVDEPRNKMIVSPKSPKYAHFVKKAAPAPVAAEQPQPAFDNLYMFSPSSPNLDFSPSSPLLDFSPSSPNFDFSLSSPNLNFSPSSPNFDFSSPMQTSLNPQPLYAKSYHTSEAATPAASSAPSTSYTSAFRPKSTAFGDKEEDELTLDPVLPNATVKQQIEFKRRQNTLAARKSRDRRLELQTGTHYGLTAEALVPIDAPTQSRNYVTPSQTSRKEMPAVFARKRAQSTAFGDEEEDDLTLEPLPPNATEQQQIEFKRRQNTVAARRSRKRKLEFQRVLEDERDMYKHRSQVWETRAKVLQEVVQTTGGQPIVWNDAELEWRTEGVLPGGRGGRDLGEELYIS